MESPPDSAPAASTPSSVVPAAVAPSSVVPVTKKSAPKKSGPKKDYVSCRTCGTKKAAPGSRCFVCKESNTPAASCSKPKKLKKRMLD